MDVLDRKLEWSAAFTTGLGLIQGDTQDCVHLTLRGTHVFDA